MNEEIMQEETGDITPEDAKASLGLATRLGEQYLMSQAPQMMEESPEEAPQEPQNAPQQEFDPQMISDIVKQAIKEEIGGLKEQITKVIEDDEQTE